MRYAHTLQFHMYKNYCFFKTGLHKPQLPVERSITLVSSIVVTRRRCALQVSSVAQLQENTVAFETTSTFLEKFFKKFYNPPLKKPESALTDQNLIKQFRWLNHQVNDTMLV